MLIDTYDPLPDPEARRPWEPNWRVVSWTIAALVIGISGAVAGDALGTLLVFVAFAAACRAVNEAVPYREGLREYRQ